MMKRFLTLALVLFATSAFAITFNNELAGKPATSTSNNSDQIPVIQSGATKLLTKAAFFSNPTITGFANFSGAGLKSSVVFTPNEIGYYMDGKSGRNTYAAWLANQSGTDVTLAMQAAIATGNLIHFPRGIYHYSTTLQISRRATGIRGDYDFRNDGSVNFGTHFQFYGSSGDAIQNGTDNGHDWDLNEYEAAAGAVQGASIDGIFVSHMTPDTPLNNKPSENYKAGSAAVRDWRGGDINLSHFGAEHFEYTFFGVQSDIDKFSKIESWYSKWGIYAGPRSDQMTIEDLYSFFCDHAVTVDRAVTTRIVRPQIVGCGSATDHAILIRQGSTDTIIEGAPWFEHLQGYNGTDQLAFVGIGTEAGYVSASTSPAGANTLPVKGVTISSPMIATTAAGATYHTKYFVELGKGTGLRITNPVMKSGYSVNNIDALVAFQSGTAYTSSDTSIYVDATQDWGGRLSVNNGTGTPDLTDFLHGQGNNSIDYNGTLSIKSNQAGNGAVDFGGMKWDAVNARLGIGTNTPSSLLHIKGDGVNAPFWLSDPTTTTKFLSLTDGSNNTIFTIDPMTATGSTQSLIRLFRNTNTSGNTSVSFYKGDGTGTENAKISGNGTTYFAVNNGNVGIGTSTMTAGVMLDVNGIAHVKNVTAASLGTVTAAGSFQYCTDCGVAATCAGGGGGHMAVSNGTNWTCQ